MANSNVNIANKLYAYIHHGADITESIKSLYNNSMIFIGDEQQIYVPVMDTYVGIGMTAYNATINRIAGVEEELKKLADTLSSDLVSKIYANYSPEDMSYLTSEDISSTWGNQTWVSNNWALNNEITLRGVNDYDPNTHLSRRISNPYQAKAQDNTQVPINRNDNDNADHFHPYSASSLATSGITITPHWGEERRITNPITGKTITKRYGNYLEIDDKLTWSYMTSAYAYTMNFTQKYTANEIDRLYHNLLGDGEGAYLPVSFSSAIDEQTTLFTDLVATNPNAVTEYNTANSGHSMVVPVEETGNPTRYFVVDLTKDYYYCYKHDADSKGIDKTYVKLSASDLQALVAGDSSFVPTGGANIIKYEEGDAEIANFIQLYVYDSQYNSTYNMNIADGIETLKEVAYLLDKLTDGQLGSVTYYTYAQVNDANGEYQSIINGENAANYEIHYVNDNPKWKPKANDTYAYLVNTGDPENLGIQIAYSIAGNRVAIDDLHQHAELLEKGETTLRSIQSTSSEFVKLTLEGGTKHWTDTDTNQGESNFEDKEGETYTHVNHPTATTDAVMRAENSYLVGDVNLKVNVLTASTYVTVNAQAGSNPYFEDAAGVKWYGTYTLADMDSLTSDGTYFRLDNEHSNPATGTYVFIEIANPELDSRNQNSDIPYYWRPGFVDGNQSEEQNLVFNRIKVRDLIAKADTDSIYTNNEEGIDIKKNQAVFYTEKAKSINGTPTLIGDSADVAQAYGDGGLGIDQYIYFVAKSEQTILHASYTTNALTTVDWVGAYVDAKVSGIADDLDNILDLAKEYTDEQIEKLDNEYIYSDFSSYFTKYCNDHKNDPGMGDLGIEGSALYNDTYEDQYSAFVTRGQAGEIGLFGDTDAGSVQNPYRLSYQINSQVISNIREENGIVHAEAKELPTDFINSDVKVWGAENNESGKKHVYSDIDGLDENTDLLHALYAWKKQIEGADTANDESDDVFDNQVFVKLAEKEYEPVAPIDNPTGSLYFKLDTDYFEALRGESGQLGDYILWDANTFINGGVNYLPIEHYSNTSDRYWKQLYRKTDKYLELNLAKITNNTGTSAQIVVDGVTYTLTLSNGKIEVTGTGVNTNDNYLKYISTSATESVEYLTVEQKHYTFKDNGNGENGFNVTAHITKLEDATPTNTGFADAFDVKSYIDNLFTWVNISATVTQSIIDANDVYHKLITLDEYMELTGVSQLRKRTENTLGVSFENVTAEYGWYWKDDNSWYGAATASDENPEGIIKDNDETLNAGEIHRGNHIKVEGHYLYKQFAATGANHEYNPANSNYYIEIEHAYTNPLNLNTTNFRDNRD